MNEVQENVHALLAALRTGDFHCTREFLSCAQPRKIIHRKQVKREKCNILVDFIRDTTIKVLNLQSPESK
jgi:hypothetical protein